MPTLSESLESARRQLGPERAADAAILLAHLLGKNRAWLHAWPDHVLTEGEYAAYMRLIAQRAAGVPVAYLTGSREFWSLDLRVTSATLIPRPDTETLVAEALAKIPADGAWRIADLGTGSGAIALALARERPACRITATDVSAAALAVADDNARRHAIGNIRFLHGRWFEPLGDDCFDLIVSNPPYIREDDPHLEQGDLPHEPRSALVAASDGLADLREIVAGASAHLGPGGWLLLEHGFDQGAAVRALLENAGFARVQTCLDLGGQERVTLGCKA